MVQVTMIETSYYAKIVAFLINNPTVGVGVFGIAVTLILFWLGDRRNRMEATFKIIEMLQESDARDARFELPDILSEAANNGGFAALSAKQRAKISSIALLFGFAGSLSRRKRIYLPIFLDSFASSVTINHYRIAEYAAWRQSFRPFKEGSLWKDFDWLAEKTTEYIRAETEPSRLGRFMTELTKVVHGRIDPIEQLFAESRSEYRSQNNQDPESRLRDNKKLD